MENSVLETIKKSLGIEDDCTAFDNELIMLTNSALSTCKQIGIFDNSKEIKDASTTWEEIAANDYMLTPLKEYLSLKIKIIFDTPTSATVLQVYNDKIKELEWRLYILGGQY